MTLAESFCVSFTDVMHISAALLLSVASAAEAILRHTVNSVLKRSLDA
jgi:hypothetical protein